MAENGAREPGEFSSLGPIAEHVAHVFGEAMEEPLPLLSPPSVQRVIDNIHHGNPKDALRALNAQLVEFDDRAPPTTKPRAHLSHKRPEPIRSCGHWPGLCNRPVSACAVLVGRRGFEPLTSCVSCKRATGLRQRPRRCARYH